MGAHAHYIKLALKRPSLRLISISVLSFLTGGMLTGCNLFISDPYPVRKSSFVNSADRASNSGYNAYNYVGYEAQTYPVSNYNTNVNQPIIHNSNITHAYKKPSSYTVPSMSSLRPILDQGLTYTPEQNGQYQAYRTDRFTPEFQSFYQPIHVPGSMNTSFVKALSTSPARAVEELKIAEATEKLKEVKSGSRLQSTLRGDLGYRQSDTVYDVVDRRDSNARPIQSVELGMTLPLFQGGRLKAQKQVANEQIETAKASLNSVENEIMMTTALAHLDVIKNRKLVEVYSDNIELLHKRKQNTDILFRYQESTLADTAVIDARLYSSMIDLESAVANLKASESLYQSLVGQPIPDILPLPYWTLPASLQEVKMLARNRNPELNTLQKEIKVADYNVDVAKSFSKPRISLDGALRGAEGFSETIRRNTSVEVALNVTVPLLSGGGNKSKVRQASLAKSIAMMKLYDLQKTLDQQAGVFWTQMQSAMRNRQHNQEQIRSAQLAYESVVKQQKAGEATIFDLLQTEQIMIEARIREITAEYEELVARLQLAKLTKTIDSSGWSPSLPY